MLSSKFKSPVMAAVGILVVGAAIGFAAGYAINRPTTLHVEKRMTVRVPPENAAKYIAATTQQNKVQQMKAEIRKATQEIVTKYGLTAEEMILGVK